MNEWFCANRFSKITTRAFFSFAYSWQVKVGELANCQCGRIFAPHRRKIDTEIQKTSKWPSRTVNGSSMAQWLWRQSDVCLWRHRVTTKIPHAPATPRYPRSGVEASESFAMEPPGEATRSSSKKSSTANGHFGARAGAGRVRGGADGPPALGVSRTGTPLRAGPGVSGRSGYSHANGPVFGGRSLADADSLDGKTKPYGRAPYAALTQQHGAETGCASQCGGRRLRRTNCQIWIWDF